MGGSGEEQRRGGGNQGNRGPTVLGSFLLLGGRGWEEVEECRVEVCTRACKPWEGGQGGPAVEVA